MTPNRLTATAFQWSISALFIFWLFAPSARPQSAATAINGVYNGTYTCAIGPRTLKLSLLASGNGSLTGMFTFYLPPVSHTQAFSYSLSGTFDSASGKFRLSPVKWETPPPSGYSMGGMDGVFDPGTDQVAGKIASVNCSAFQATRDQAESANAANVIAPQKSAGSAPSPLPSASTGGDKLPATTNQTSTPYYCVTSQISQPTVYFSESFDTPGADIGTVSRAYKTYLAQKYAVKSSVGIMCTSYGTLAAAEDARQKRLAQLTQGKQWAIDKTGWKYTAPPTTAATQGGTTGSSVSVVQNSATPNANPAPPARPSPTAPASKATAAASLPTAPNGNKPACQLISKSSLESILGFQYSEPEIVPVDEGKGPFSSLGIIASSSCQYVTKLESESGVTLTVWYTKDLDPVIAKDYFFHYLAEKFSGRLDVTSPGFPYPAVFSNVSGGTYFFKGGPDGLTILMVQSHVLPQDKTSGEEVYVARAEKIALKILGLPQPLAASARRTTTAPSGPTTPAGIVNKPKVYWETYYRTDLIRQVFDGTFVGDPDSSRQFQMLFNTYVDMFSSHCSADLPARHEVFTVTSQQTGQPSTVEVDSRFAPAYQQYFKSLAGTSGQSLADSLAIASGRVSQDDYFAPGTDMIKFFKIETCQSAAMRQLGENLLRAAER